MFLLSCCLGCCCLSSLVVVVLVCRLVLLVDEDVEVEEGEADEELDVVDELL